MMFGDHSPSRPLRRATSVYAPTLFRKDACMAMSGSLTPQLCWDGGDGPQARQRPAVACAQHTSRPHNPQRHVPRSTADTARAVALPPVHAAARASSRRAGACSIACGVRSLLRCRRLAASYTACCRPCDEVCAALLTIVVLRASSRETRCLHALVTAPRAQDRAVSASSDGMHAALHSLYDVPPRCGDPPCRPEATTRACTAGVRMRRRRVASPDGSTRRIPLHATGVPRPLP